MATDRTHPEHLPSVVPRRTVSALQRPATPYALRRHPSAAVMHTSASPNVPADPDEGDRAALDEVFSLAYDELRRLAAAVHRSDSAATLSPTALVNEAWIKLAATPQVARTSPLHFRRIAARAMRQVLIEAARRRTADKRGGVGQQAITLDEHLVAGVTTADELLSLNEALDALAAINPRQARIVEVRFFAGLEVLETAELLGVSEATIMRDWRAARAWLAARMTEQP